MPTSYNYFKKEIQQYIVAHCHPYARILDVGAGCGTYSDLLKDYDVGDIDAVEIWQPYIDQYKLNEKYTYVYNKDIRNFSEEFLSSYDFIILGDVLEHLSHEDATELLAKLDRNQKKYVVAVPYSMEQGEYEGNVHETHLQPDLTPENMSTKYPNLELLYSNQWYGYYKPKVKKHEKAFVLYANSNYFDLARTCIRSIRAFSDIHIIIFVISSSAWEDFENEGNVSQYPLDIPFLNIKKKRDDFIDRSNYSIYRLLMHKPLAMMRALRHAECVAFVDVDSVASPYVDRIFDYYDPNAEYPYFTAGVYDYLMINGRGGAASKDDLSGTLEAPVCDLFKIDQSVREVYRQTGYFIAGQKCKRFLDIWFHRCQHPDVLADNKKYAKFNEETILQTMLYDWKIYNGLPYCYINGLHENLQYKSYEYFAGDWIKVPLKTELQLHI